MMELNIKVLSGKTQSVTVNPSATIGELKRQVAPLFRVKPSQLKLSITDGQTLQLDHDQKMVRDYGLCSGSTVLLITPIHIFVKHQGGNVYIYNITDDETVDQLMTKVSQKERKPKDQLRLIFSGRQLESGKKLVDYNIVYESMIYSVLRLSGGGNKNV